MGRIYYINLDLDTIGFGRMDKGKAGLGKKIIAMKKEIFLMVFLLVCSVKFYGQTSILYYNWFMDSVMVTNSLDLDEVVETYFIDKEKLTYKDKVYYQNTRKKSIYSDSIGIKEYVANAMTLKLPYTSGNWVVNAAFLINAAGFIDAVWLSGNANTRGLIYDKELIRILYATNEKWKPLRRGFKRRNTLPFVKLILAS